MGSLFSVTRSIRTPSRSPPKNKTPISQSASTCLIDSGYHSKSSHNPLRKRPGAIDSNNSKRARLDDWSVIPAYLPRPRGHSALKSFFQLLDDDIIQDFLWFDCNFLLLDKYLLAMVYVYFKRTQLPMQEYSPINFFAALWLAWDMEEDDEDHKELLLPWALGKDSKNEKQSLLKIRNTLWKKMGFRGIVSKLTCDEVMMLAPGHPLWARKRQERYGGASREYSTKLLFSEDLMKLCH
eukprot:m.23354 g.23354  ORF g.23354 m.23354 type:complete len:238 (+) comp28458_c0_seq4:117-830(+)